MQQPALRASRATPDEGGRGYTAVLSLLTTFPELRSPSSFVREFRESSRPSPSHASRGLRLSVPSSSPPPRDASLQRLPSPSTAPNPPLAQPAARFASRSLP